MPDALKLGLDQPTGLGSAMAGGKGRLATTERRELDFYPTEPEATQALLLAELPAMRMHGSAVWECCGRGGAIANVIRPHGLDIFATDIVADPVNHVAQLDVLKARKPFAPIGVTNPPFGIAKEIIHHLLGQLRMPYLALLLKTTFWSTNTEDRGNLGLWRVHPPHRRWDMTWRVDFTGGGQSTMNVSWFIWDTNHTGPRTWGLLGRNGPIESSDLFSA